MASFTFGSVGDIITVCGLAANAVSALSETGGSADQYQELYREIVSLQSALRSVARVIENEPRVSGSIELRDALSKCYTCLETYLQRIKKYHAYLKERSPKYGPRSAYMKLRWQTKQDDLARFRTEVATHMTSISALLDTLTINVSKRDQDSLRRELESGKLAMFSMFDDNRNLLLQMDANIERRDQSFARVLEDIARISSEQSMFSQQVKGLMNTFNGLLLENRIPQKLDRTWTQDPVILEDAFLRVFPVHLEFINSWEAFCFVLSGHFKGTPGEEKVGRNEFVLQDEHGQTIDAENQWSVAFHPGQKIFMAISFYRKRVPRKSCPICLADTQDATDCEVECKECFQRYRRIVECREEMVRQSESNDLAIPTQDGRIPEFSILPEDVENDDEEEPTDDFHPFKRLALVTNTDQEVDAVSERAIQNLLTYGLAGDRSQAIAMLLAKSNQARAKAKAEGGTVDATPENQERLIPTDKNALISVDKTDRRSRMDMTEIIHIAEEISPPENPSTDDEAIEEAQLSYSSFVSSRRGSDSSNSYLEGQRTSSTDIKDFIRRSVLPELMKNREKSLHSSPAPTSSPHTPVRDRVPETTESHDAMTQKIVKLTRELHLLDGVDLHSLTISRERKLSRKIAQAYQEQQWKPKSIDLSSPPVFKDLSEFQEESLVVQSDLLQEYKSIARHWLIGGTVKRPYYAIYTALFDYAAEISGLLSFKKGDLIDVTSKGLDGWLYGSTGYGTLHPESGWFRPESERSPSESRWFRLESELLSSESAVQAPVTSLESFVDSCDKCLDATTISG